MAQINVYNLEGKKKSKMDLPRVFNVKPRLDLIQKAHEIMQSRNKQVQGRDKRAGLKKTAVGWGTGHGLSRAPRIKGSGFMTARNVGRVPFAKGGRRAHPIKAEKNIVKKMNKKTLRNSLLSAISASANPNWIKERGYIVEDVPEFPLVIDDKIQTIKRTSNIYSVLCELGLEKDLYKTKNSKKIRAGKGKRRGRKYKSRKGILIVIKEDYGIVKASKNLPGTDIVKLEQLSVENLAPGGTPGRLVLWTQSAINDLNDYEV